MKISIVTATFNSERTLGQTIQSVLDQGYDDVEHIVVDGGSTDGTIDILKSHQHIKWTSEPDDGIYHAMQKGMDRATGDVLAVLNSDDYYLPGALNAVSDAFADHPNWDSAFGDVHYVNDEGVVIHEKIEAGYDYNVLRYGAANLVVDQALFYRAEAFRKLGEFRSDDFVSCADYEMIMRLGAKGFHVGHIDRVLTNFRLHDFGQSSDRRVIENMKREIREIRDEYGVPRGIRFRALECFYKGVRQFQKLRKRGTINLIPASWKFERYRRDQNQFSSNLSLPD